MAFNIFKPFLSGQLIHGITFHDSLESLHDHVPKEILPEEFGGMQGIFDNSTCANRSINNKIYFTQLQRINE